MATVVELGAIEGFRLDDPVAGVLDNTEYTLGGTVFKNISDRVKSLTIQRGKNRDLDRFNAGQLNIQLNNNDRAFDPNYASSPFAGAIIPRREIRVTVDGERAMTAVVDDWNYSYSPDGEAVAEIVASDDFTLLARQVLTAGTATPELTGARVTAVLDQPSVNWPADRRSIDAGNSTLGDDVFEGNVLQYLQTVGGASEQGLIFISKNGDFTFRDRLDATPTTASLVSFADDGSGIPFNLTAVNYGSELLYNQSIVSSAAGTAQADNELSQYTYGVSAYELQTLVNSTAQLQNIADFIVQKYGDPEYRFETISVNLDTLGAGDKATVLGLEIGDVIDITFTPGVPKIGDAIQQYGQIIALSHEVETDRHDLLISVASLDWTFLVLDDSVFGKLDSNNALAF